MHRLLNIKSDTRAKLRPHTSIKDHLHFHLSQLTITTNKPYNYNHSVTQTNILKKMVSKQSALSFIDLYIMQCKTHFQD